MNNEKENAEKSYVNPTFEDDEEIWEDNKVVEDKVKTKPPPVRYYKLFRFSKRTDYFLMSLGVLGSVLTGLSAPANTFIFGDLTNALISYKPGKEEEFLKEIDTFAINNTLIGIALMTISYLSILLYNTSSRRQSYRIRLLYFQSALRQDIGWYDVNTTGDFASRISEDLNKLEDGISEKVLQVIHSLSAFLGCIIMALLMGWKLALISSSALPVMFIWIKLISLLSTKLAKTELQAYAKAASVAEEVLTSVKTVVAFNGQAKEIQRYEEHLVFAKRNNIKKRLFGGITFGLLWFLLYGSYGISFWFGVQFVWDGDYTPGQMTTVFFSVIVGSMNALIVAPYVEIFASAVAAARTIFWVIDRKSPIDPTSDVGKKPQIEGFIEFKNVVFSYPSRPDIPVLKGISLKINKGEKVAFVGSSGCGKSTCVQLIQRFYDPDEGQILIDGEDIKELNVKHLRKSIGVVGQEPVLFAATLKQNIRYSKEDATDEEIVAAAEMANAHIFIKNLPKGYDTLIGERGAQISGGQKQRIAIARALVRNPSILLLDEATSALDNESEAKVQQALDKASEGRTTIIVAHRLSTIRHANRIIVLSQGKIVEEGTHEELYEKKGYYYELVTAQADLFEDEEVGSDDDETVMKLRSRRASDGSLVGEPFRQTKSEASEAKEKQADKVPFRKILRMSAPEWRSNTTGTVASMIMGCCSPLFTVVFGDVMGVFSHSSKEKALHFTKLYCTWFALIGALMGVSTFFQMWAYGIAGEKLSMRLRSLTFSAMLRQEMAWYDERENSVGALCSRLSGDTSNVQAATGQPIGAIVQAIATIILAIAFSMIFQWKLGLVTLSLTPVLIAGSYFLAKNLRGGASKTQKVLEKSTNIAVEAIGNIRTVAGLGREIRLYEEFKKELKPANKVLLQGIHIKGLIMGVSRSLLFYAYALCMFYGGRLIAYEEESYENIFKVTQTLIVASFSIANAFALAPNFQKGLASAAKIYTFLKREPKIQDPTNTLVDSTWAAEGEVRCSNINFTYPTRPNEPVLRNFSLDVLKGKKVALVGESGCGKSTVIQLLERFYDPNSGTLMLDNYKIGDLKLKILRKQLGIVSQEPVLFDKTIAENIAYGDNERDVPMNEIIDAAKEANIHNFISNLPLGYDTPLGEKGTQLSGGQKQRIAIARALIRKPKVLLLDEATSALDTKSEKIVQEALDKASAERTCITIAHRLTTIVDADLIVVMRHGKVVEMGSHAELLAKKGIYRRLFILQGMR